MKLYFVWDPRLPQNLPFLVEHYHLTDPRCKCSNFEDWILDCGSARYPEGVDCEKYLFDAEKLQPTYVVAPDVKFDLHKTCEMLRRCGPKIKQLRSVVIFPIQSRAVSEIAEFVRFAFSIRRFKVRFGVPCKMSRVDPQPVVDVVKRFAVCKFLHEDLGMKNIHLLGLYSIFELFYPGVSSGDSSLVSKVDPFSGIRKLGCEEVLEKRVMKVLDFVRCIHEHRF